MSIDLNADIGEDVGSDPIALDSGLLNVVSSANVACGGHAGDDDTMRRVTEQAAERRVAVGAHISFVDREGFGRLPQGVSPQTLEQQLIEQIGRLDVIAAQSGTAVTYVKPHGALYHRACSPGSDEAAVVIDAVIKYNEQSGRSLWVLGFAGSELVKRAKESGVRTANEAFADRRYTPEGWLVSRSAEDALITDPKEALSRLGRLLRDSEIIAIDGTPIEVHAESICIHGDTPGAVVLARRVKAAIDSDRVKIAPFAPPPANTSSPRPAN